MKNRDKKRILRLVGTGLLILVLTSSYRYEIMYEYVSVLSIIIMLNRLGK
jgi:hypothetical protein